MLPLSPNGYCRVWREHGGLPAWAERAGDAAVVAGAGFD